MLIPSQENWSTSPLATSPSSPVAPRVASMDSIKGHDFSFQIITELEIARKNLLKCRFVNTLLSGVDIHHCSFEDCNFTGLRVGDVGLSHLIKKETYPKL